MLDSTFEFKKTSCVFEKRINRHLKPAKIFHLVPKHKGLSNTVIYISLYIVCIKAYWFNDEHQY